MVDKAERRQGGVAVEKKLSPERALLYMTAWLRHINHDGEASWYAMYHTMPSGLRDYIGHNPNETAVAAAKRALLVVEELAKPLP